MHVEKTPDSGYARIMKKKIKGNNGYCPNELEKTPDTKCPCKAFREKQTAGYCGCGYYILVDDEEEMF